MTPYTPIERDDIKAALTQLLGFYDKELTQEKWPFWWSVLKKVPHGPLLRAMREYPGEGVHAPRPASIVQIAKKYMQTSASQQDAPLRLEKQAPTPLSDAWMWYMAMNSKGSSCPMFQSALEGVSDEQADKYLHLVNEDAVKQKQPEAIAKEHRLREYFGD